MSCVFSSVHLCVLSLTFTARVQNPPTHIHTRTQTNTHLHTHFYKTFSEHDPRVSCVPIYIFFPSLPGRQSFSVRKCCFSGASWKFSVTLKSCRGKSFYFICISTLLIQKRLFWQCHKMLTLSFLSCSLSKSPFIISNIKIISRSVSHQNLHQLGINFWITRNKCYVQSIF